MPLIECQTPACIMFGMPQQPTKDGNCRICKTSTLLHGGAKP